MTIAVETVGPDRDASSTLANFMTDTVRSLRAFALVGIAATLVHYLVLIILVNTYIVPSVALANILGFSASISVTYLGNRFFVFQGKRGHLHGFVLLLIGYLFVMTLHTGMMVGLTQGYIFEFLAGPAGNFGGDLLLGIWSGIIDLIPAGIAGLMTGDDTMSTSTTLAFLAASGLAAIINYCWSRFVVFEHKRH